jgi:hypothetical protein
MNISSFTNVAKVLPPQISILLRGSTGIGKSHIVRDLAKEFGVEMIDVRGSTMVEGDVSGYPDLEAMKRSKVMTFCMPSWFVKACKEPVVLFLDEFNRATPQVMQSFFQIVLDRELGNDENGNPYKLHPQTRVYAAINAGNEYDVNDMDPALLRRFYVCDLESTTEDWLKWAKANNVDPIIIEFIQTHGSQLNVKLSDVKPGEVFPTPASWTRLNDCIKYAQINLNNILGTNKSSSILNSISLGLVGQSAAAEFVKFVRNYNTILTAENILDDLENYVEKIKKIDNDKLNALLGKIYEHACLNDWTQDQAANCAIFAKLISQEMLIYLWNQISKCKREKNVIALHKFIATELVNVINLTKNTK